jgi:hypothetical protein
MTRPSLHATVVLVLVVAAGTYLGPKLTRSDSTFSVSARTEVLTLHTACAQDVVWDLPPGQISTPERLDAGQAPTSGNAIALALRGGAQARVRLDEDRHWLVEAAPDPLFGCADGAGRAAPDTTTAQVDGVALPPAPQGFVYRSARPAREARHPLWLLRGRVVLGQEIAFGAGLESAAAAPILGTARIEARSPDGSTAQRRLIHEETVEAGGLIDTHACLSKDADALPGCVRGRAWTAQGFVHLGAPDGPPGFDVQLSLVGERLGVRQQAAGERQIVVTWWQHLVTESRWQIAAALVVLGSTLAALLPALGLQTFAQLLPHSRLFRWERRRARRDDPDSSSFPADR